MQHTIENEFLTVTVESKGAELVSVVDKATGAEMMWDGQKDVWPRRAPILFPYCGKLSGGRYTLDDETYEGGQHGFGRDLEHEFVGAENGVMRFVLRSNEETRKKLPRDFALESTFTLTGRTLRQTTADYCDNMLKTTEETMIANASQVKNVRASLRQPPKK